ALKGRDKVTLAIAPPLAPLGPWLEQLVSESTGKDGKGIVIVEGEPLGAPEVYGDDGVFVQLTLGRETSPDGAALEKAGCPVLRLAVPEVIDLGREMYRWQVATAAAGSVLGVNPFSMPDVEAAKVAARARLDAEAVGEDETPLLSDNGLSLFADAG